LCHFVFITRSEICKYDFTGDGDNTPDKNAPDVRNIPYSVGGITFDLINGRAEKEYSPGSASKNTLTIFSEPVFGDLDNDGDTDAAILLANDPGGSGTFYYAVLAINNGNAYQATNAMLLGDRISSQTVEIKEGRALFNYIVRKANEPMSAEPSISKSVWIHFDKKTGRIGEWIKDFEGEADPGRMTLGMKTWTWISTTYNNDTKIEPRDSTKFTLVFKADKTFSATTDCNSVRGKYVVNENRISFGDVIAAGKFCEGSQESDFVKMLGAVNSYFFTSRGELVFDLKFDSGSMIFR
jgi:heat shock protein HslJ